MSDSVQTPWILEYLISVAEQYGGDLSAVPRTQKACKAQLVKFLTFAPPGSTEPCLIWADVSDKKHFIHARLSIDAMKLYQSNPAHQDVSITSYKSAFVRLKRFRPAFGRVARRECIGGMTDHPRLYLDVDEIDMMGCYGDPMWGAPVDIAQDPNIREWMLGLQQDGGGGNILKLKKERLLAQAAEQANRLQMSASEMLHQTTINAMDVKVRVARKSAAHRPRPSADGAGQRPVASKEAVRRASWKRLHANMMKYIRPPDDVYEQLLMLCGYPREPVPISDTDSAQLPQRTSRSRSRSRSGSRTSRRYSVESNASSLPRAASAANLSSPARTPSHWSPSVNGSPAPARGTRNRTSDTEDESDDDLFKEDSDASMDEGTPSHPRACSPEVEMNLENFAPEPEPSPDRSLPMPESAQPRREVPPSSMPSVPYASSPPRASSPTAYRPSKDTMDTLPPSSFPAASYRLPPSPTSSPRHVPMTPAPAYPAPAVRRVPLPQYNFLRRDPDASGHGRVLVENSDTASPGSQRPSQSQSQDGSHCTTQSDGNASHSQDQPHSQSQSQRPSQLRNQIEPEQDPAGEVSRRHEDGAAEGGQGQQPMNVDNSQGSQGQPQGRSQQSLSYKGDSQSQEGAAAPEPEAGAEQAVGDSALPESPGSAGDDDSAVADDAPGRAQEPEEPVQRPPSPMAVDQNPPAPSSAPGWAVIPSLDDSEDSQTEVDELLSDPLAMAAQDVEPPKRPRAAARPGHVKALPRKTVGRQAGNTGERERERECEHLESDDERTAAVIARYTAKAQKVIAARKQAAGGVDVAPHPEEVEAGSVAGPSRPSQPLEHDPSVWAVPTFMQHHQAPQVTAVSVARKTSSEKVKVEQASPPRSRKRTARPSSPSPDRQAPAKKRKTSSTVVPVSKPPPVGESIAKQKQVRSAPENTSGQAAGRPSTSILAEPSMHESAASSSRPAVRKSSAVPQPATRPSAGSASAGSSREVKHADLHAASRPSSRASSRASHFPEGSARAAQGTTLGEQRLSSSAKGKSVLRASSSREGKPTEASSRASTSRNASSASLDKAGRRSGSLVAGSDLKGKGKASNSSTVPARQPREARAPLLGGLDISLEPPRVPGGPPLLGWDELAKILVCVGRERHERDEAQRKRSGGEK